MGKLNKQAFVRQLNYGIDARLSATVLYKRTHEELADLCRLVSKNDGFEVEVSGNGLATYYLGSDTDGTISINAKHCEFEATGAAGCAVFMVTNHKTQRTDYFVRKVGNRNAH